MFNKIDNDVQNFVLSKKDEIIELLRLLVAAKSVCCEQTAENAPYGDGARKALDIMLTAAEEKGIFTSDGMGRFGFAELPGESDEYIATLAHLDVVPPGDGWATDPYVLVERDGWLLGRGVEDDKGPAVLTLFLLEYFKDKPLKYKLRAIFGCDEESGMSDIDFYNELYEPPVFAFTPDSSFPVSYGEKHIIVAELLSEKICDKIIELKGAEADNVIPEGATALVRCNRDLPCTVDITTEKIGDCVRIYAKGVGGHPAYPDGTVNALHVLLKYIVDMKICDGDELSAILFLCEVLSTTDGSPLGIDVTMPHFSPLTAAGTQLKIEDGCFKLILNIRAPFGCELNNILADLNETATKNGFDMTPVTVSYGLFQDPEGKGITILREVYDELSGKSELPCTSNGGTYARKLANCVSYGIDIHGEEKPDFVGSIHGRNEGVKIDRLLFSLGVYITAVKRIMNEI